MENDWRGRGVLPVGADVEAGWRRVGRAVAVRVPLGAAELVRVVEDRPAGRASARERRAVGRLLVGVLRERAGWAVEERATPLDLRAAGRDGRAAVDLWPPDERDAPLERVAAGRRGRRAAGVAFARERRDEELLETEDRCELPLRLLDFRLTWARFEDRWRAED